VEIRYNGGNPYAHENGVKIDIYFPENNAFFWEICIYSNHTFMRQKWPWNTKFDVLGLFYDLCK